MAGWLTAALSLSVGCAAPNIELGNCQATCNASVECTNGMECRNNFCVHPDMLGSCVAASGGSGGSSTTSGGASSGTGNNTSLGGTTAGSSGEGGTSNAAGVAGTHADAGGTASIGEAGKGAGTASNAGGNLGGSLGGNLGSNVGGSSGASGGLGDVGGVAGLGGTVTRGGGGGVAGETQSGAGGWGEPGTIAIAVAPALPEHLCSGVSYSAALSATVSIGSPNANQEGGAGASYNWSAGDPVPGMTLSPSSGPTATWSGTPTQAGNYPLAVIATDGLHAPGALAITIDAAPQITSPLAVSGCLGQQYQAMLAATGGGNYAWSATLPPELGLTLASNGELSGTLSKIGEFSFEVAVRDAVTGCTAAKKQITLTVNDDSTQGCLAIAVKGLSSATLAPASCRAWPYTTTFEVSGGTAPYTWEALERPAGLEFDALSQKVTGTATASGSLKLRVTDNAGRVVVKIFAIPLRERCWFGYVSDETTGSRLHLVDPLLGTRLQRPTSNSTELSVTDFQFSPDGKFVAYRVKDASGAYKLSLWQAPGWDHEQELPLGGSVTHYAWSNNSLVLAAAITTATDTLLGGVNVSAVPNNPTVGGIQGLRLLDTVSAPVESELTWYGQDGYIAFSSLDDPTEPDLSPSDVHHSKYTVNGFEAAVTPDVWYDPSVFLVPSPTGFFAVEAVTPNPAFYGVLDTLTQHSNVAISPSGGYTANSRTGLLQLFRARDPSWPVSSSVPWLSTNGCSTLLGWATNQERLACVDQPNSTVRIHTLDPVASALRSAAVQSSASYVGGGWSGFRRSVSASGNWLASTTSDRFFLSTLAADQPATLWSTVPTSPPAATEVVFSPDERFVTLQRGTSFRLFEVRSLATAGFDYGNLATDAEACQEVSLAVPNWCGSGRAPAQPVWSPDAQLFAQVLQGGQLLIRDLSNWSTEQGLRVEIAVGCGVRCIGGMRFQPNPG